MSSFSLHNTLFCQAMEKKKVMEAMQRTQDMNTASKQAFMKAVSKNKSQPNHENKG